MIALNGGRPEAAEADATSCAPSSISARRSSRRRTKFELEQGARPRPYPGRPRHRGRQYRRGDPPHPHLARRGGGARGADGARLAGARHGAAGRADRRPAPCDRRATAPAACRKRRRARILDLRLQRLTALGRDEIADELEEAGRRDRRISRNPALARRGCSASSRRTGRGEGRFATPRRTQIIEVERRHRGRGSDPARGHGGHRLATPATSSACRSRPIARSGAAARAAPAWRPARRISSRGCSSPRPTRRCCSSPRAARSTS